jgi:hypothetical protein
VHNRTWHKRTLIDFLPLCRHMISWECLGCQIHIAIRDYIRTLYTSKVPAKQPCWRAVTHHMLFESINEPKVNQWQWRINTCCSQKNAQTFQSPVVCVIPWSHSLQTADYTSQENEVLCCSNSVPGHLDYLVCDAREIWSWSIWCFDKDKPFTDTGIRYCLISK